MQGKKELNALIEKKYQKFLESKKKTENVLQLFNFNVNFGKIKYKYLIL